MAALSTIVSVSISIQDAALTQAGFGVPLIMTHEAPYGPGLVQSYASTTEMIAAGFSATGATVAAATAIFAQNPKIPLIKTGVRGSSPSTMTRVLTVQNAVVGEVYSITINGTVFSYTAIVADTPTLVAVALDALINAGSEPVTCADVGAVLTLTEDVAGDLFGLSHDITKITQDDTTADAGAAADYAAIKLEDNEFYGVLMTSSATLEILALATPVESDKKLFLFNSADQDIADGVASNLFEVLQTAARVRTAGIFSTNNFEFASAAWMGKQFASDPGSSTWAYKTLGGVSAVPLTTTQQGNIQGYDGNHYTVTGGINITFSGLAFSGRFLDITRGIDWLEARIQERVAGRIINSPKINYDDPGIAVIQAEVEAQLQEAIGRNVLAADPAPTTTVPKAADVSAADKAGRILRDVNFSATLAGAIHTVVIQGTVSP